MVPPSSTTAKSINPEPRPSTPSEPESSEPRHPWFRFFLNSKDKSPRKPKINTPDSSADLINTPSTSRKKVGWSEKYDYKDPPRIITDRKTLSAQALSPLTPSAERKATKSILKTHHVPDPTQNIVPSKGDDTTLTSKPLMVDARMLESISKQLAGKDRGSKLDAYTTLSGALKACDNVPDRKALSDKMDLILQFMKRDLNAKLETGALDTQLAKEALVLMSSFLYKKSIADMLTPEFNGYIVDYALKTFENPGMSKEVVRHLMFIIAQQKFSARIMTADRVTKLISAIHNIEDYVRGKSIVEQRINIYRTFLRQSRAHMISNSDWLGDLFSDMLNSYSNIQTAAIAFGEEAGLELGTESKISSKVTEIFKGSDGKDVKYVDFFAERLRIMAKKPSSSTPRIWAAVILFLRARPKQLEHWAFIKTWLDVIKVCFNSSDQNTKLAANLAWNRMIFVITLEEKVSFSMINTLSQPLILQLPRKDVRKISNSDNLHRKSTLSSICNLFYYSVKPNTTQAQLDTFWDTYIIQIVRDKLIPTDFVENPALAKQDLGDACNILCGLFNAHTQRPWIPTRALNDNAVTPRELPGFDPRWLRKSASRVFSVLSPLMELLFWELALPKSRISLLWETYIFSISSAAAKEVKTSNDTMSCLAFLFSTLYKIWQKGPDGLHTLTSHRKNEANFLANFQVIVTTAISGLGVLPFTERLLSMGQQDDFIVVATPSHRPGKTKGDIRSPLHHLLLLISSPPLGFKHGLKFSEMAEAILMPFFETRRSSKGKMDLVKDLLEILPTDVNESCGALWSILAKLATAAINFRDDVVVTSTIHDSRPLGAEYRSVARILDVGIDLSPKEPLKGWEDLFQALVTSATTDSGHGGRAIVVIEPIAKALASNWRSDDDYCGNKVVYCQILVKEASYPKDRQALDAARRRLWGSATAGPKIHIFDPYFQLYQYISRCLRCSYTELSSNDHITICGLLGEVEALLVRCPKVLFGETLTQLQNGIICWISDEEAKLHGGSDLSRSVNSLWNKICSLLSSTDLSKNLNNLEPLLCAGLGSKRVYIANSAIEMWKDAFGSFKGDLQYPPMVKEVLSRVLPMTDLSLASLSESSENQISNNHRQLLDILDTQTDINIFNEVNLPKISNKAPSSIVIQAHKQKSINSSPRVIEVNKAGSRKRSRETTPEPGKRKSRKKGFVAKLRHDDSQIQFEAIAGSSPFSETTYDSQLLTERQKEVRERQAEEAAMFSDIRSSPHLSSKLTPKHVDNDIELPSRHSASKLLLETPASSERQSTPDTKIVENQDMFLTSSPTPARHVLSSKDVSRSPSSPAIMVDSQKRQIQLPRDSDMAITSSPPEAKTRNNVPRDAVNIGQNDFEQSPLPSYQSIYQSTSMLPTSSDEFNVTSFPNNFPDEINNNVTTNRSLDAPTQVDPYDFDLGQTMSTYRSSPRDSDLDEDMDATVELTSSEEQARDEELQQIFADHKTSKAWSVQVAETFMDPVKNERAILPSTPRRSRRGAAAMLPAPSSSKGYDLDARPSVTHSDRPTNDEEIFEDATSSPRGLPPRIQELSMTNTMLNNSSSPLSDIDESSFIKLAKSVDRALAENQGGVLRQTHASAELATVSVHAEPIRKIPSPNRRSPIRPVSQSSAIQSVILETPAPQLLNRNGKENALHGSVADDSDSGSITSAAPHAGQQQARPTNTIKSPKRFNKKNTPNKFKVEDKTRGDGDGDTPAKKRKFDETLEVGSAVVGSQEASRNALSVPPIKKRKGRPAKTPEPVATQSISEAQSAQSQRSGRATRRNTRSSRAKTILENNSSMSVSREFSSVPDITETGSSVIANDRPTMPVSSTEAVDGITRNDSEHAGKISPVLEQFDEPELDFVEETLLQSQIAEEMEFGSQKANDDQQAEIVEPATAAPTYQTIKERLLSLVRDLGDAALNREEGNEVEDIFMDAKVQLYGAIRRGRQSADD
ncbi:putative telomere length regulator protein [Botrytis fragariae]|uniref:Putative telomere length regulator protein n=1 Tax=Botrytis fragariae TaxID=1964551 RepID=A0A8H6EMZ0_9HELO|nr:putative telomere length regulator protein [Botrytis fragariae]KAF5878054.1 putative telomere length regulator protein [Botrytis fragariae]